MSMLLNEWWSEYLIVFDEDEYVKIDINQKELRGLKQEVFFRELNLNLKEIGGVKEE